MDQKLLENNYTGFSMVKECYIALFWSVFCSFGHNFGLLLGWKLSPVSQNIHFKRSERVYKGTFCWDFEIRPKKIKKSIKFGSWRVQKWVRPENLTIFFKKSALGRIKSLNKPVKCIGGANYAQYQKLGTIIAPDGGFRMAKWAFFWT